MHHLTVGRLRELLVDLPEDTPVVAIDHFGEGIPYRSYSARSCNTNSPYHHEDHLLIEGNEYKGEYLEVQPPDIEEEPD